MSTDSKQKTALLKNLPAVHEILDRPRLKQAQADQSLPRWALRQAVQIVLERQRTEIIKGERADVQPFDHLESDILKETEKLLLPSLRSVINATGVLLHTNLGRAPLAKEALDAILETAKGYSNLEFNLDTGKRGLRYQHVEALLCEITGAEAALVVNNNAAAVFLALRALAKGKEVIVSRGELVEIGGSFRIPDILRESDAELVEVGTTNRVHVKDYEQAIRSSSGLLLKVHPSNYRVIGFYKEVELEELVALGRRFSLPVMHDLGSGCMLDPQQFNLQGEPSVKEALESGVDLVTFSGDKLLGGPQAGIMLGRERLLHKIQGHPLNRIMRIDKLTLAALEATLHLYRDSYLPLKNVPALAMLTAKQETIRKRAQRLAGKLKKILPSSFQIGLQSTVARTGGGSMPQEAIPGTAVRVRSTSYSAATILARLRLASPPVIARIEKDEVILDVRTMQKGEEPLLCGAFKETFV